MPFRRRVPMSSISLGAFVALSRAARCRFDGLHVLAANTALAVVALSRAARCRFDRRGPRRRGGGRRIGVALSRAARCRFDVLSEARASAATSSSRALEGGAVPFRHVGHPSCMSRSLIRVALSRAARCRFDAPPSRARHACHLDVALSRAARCRFDSDASVSAALHPMVVALSRAARCRFDPDRVSRPRRPPGLSRALEGGAVPFRPFLHVKAPTEQPVALSRAARCRFDRSSA